MRLDPVRMGNLVRPLRKLLRVIAFAHRLARKHATKSALSFGFEISKKPVTVGGLHGRFSWDGIITLITRDTVKRASNLR